MRKFKNCRNAFVTLSDSFVLILCENECVQDGFDGLLILDSCISNIGSCDHERGPWSILRFVIELVTKVLWCCFATLFSYATAYFSAGQNVL